MAVKTLHEIAEDRDIESSVDENTLIAGETGAGTFGAYKFFGGVKKAIEYIISRRTTKIATCKHYVLNSSTVTDISVNAGYSNPKGFLVVVSGHSSSGDATYTNLMLLRIGYSGNNTPRSTTIATLNGSGATTGNVSFTQSNGYLKINLAQSVLTFVDIYGV